jgi:hypothetical protein
MAPSSRETFRRVIIVLKKIGTKLNIIPRWRCNRPFNRRVSYIATCLMKRVSTVAGYLILY